MDGLKFYEKMSQIYYHILFLSILEKKNITTTGFHFKSVFEFVIFLHFGYLSVRKHILNLKEKFHNYKIWIV